MDPSWYHHHGRPPPPPQLGGAPPLQVGVCPVCSTYHFPFCPPTVHQNYPIIYHHHQHQHQHQRPPSRPQPDQLQPQLAPRPPPISPPTTAYDPFVDRLGGPVPGADSRRPFLDSQRPPWSADSGFDGDPHGDSYAYGRYGDAGAKRMRFDDPGFSSLSSNEPPANPSAEEVRRLKLIRDHGGAMSHEFDRNYGKKRSLDETSNIELKPNNGLYTHSSLNTEFDRKGNSLCQEGDMQRNAEGKLGQQYKSEFGVLRDKQPDGSLRQTNVYDYNRHSFNTTEQPRQSNEAMGYNWQGGAVYNGRRNGFGIDFHGVGNQFLHKFDMQHGMEPKPNQYGHLNNQQPPPSGSSAPLFPICSSSSSSRSSSYPPVPEYHRSKGHLHPSTGFVSEELRSIQPATYNSSFGGNEIATQRPVSPNGYHVIDATHIMKHPHRATRPDRIVIILRGLPGSGKSYLAKIVRDLEVENGGNVPRIHSMDDYFMTEVEKVEEIEVPKTSGSVRGKKTSTKKTMEFSYEPEMEEAYRSSMLKAFKKTLDDGVFNFVIVDDRNLRVADFTQFWATAKRSGYEVYLLEATYKDPAGCAARNVHGFIQDDIQKMADLWEEAPSLYLKLDIKSLLHGDGSEDNGILEVDMDMEDGGLVGDHSGSEDSNVEKLVVPAGGGLVSDGSLKQDQGWNAEVDLPLEEVKELGKSKWSNDLEDDELRQNVANRKLTAVSGLTQSYNKEGKSVRWGDQVQNHGFSIAAAKPINVASLVIGPGAGYNLKSNPLSDEEKTASSYNAGESKKQMAFQERLRAEHESFKAVFDKRKERISGLGGESSGGIRN